MHKGKGRFSRQRRFGNADSAKARSFDGDTEELGRVSSRVAWHGCVGGGTRGEDEWYWKECG